MPREIHLDGLVSNDAGENDERDIIIIGEGDTAKRYRLRPMTRAQRQKVNVIEEKILAVDEQRNRDELTADAYYDRLVDVFTEGIDVLLEIDSSGETKSRTPASKLLLARYQENKMTWAQIGSYYSGLREETEAARPI